MAWIRSSFTRQPEIWRKGPLLRLGGAMALSIMVIGLSGCWPFGHDKTPPQQQYFNALKLGNAAQASQLWLHMTPEQRLEFERGQNIRPSVSPKEVQRAVVQHYADQIGNDDGSAPTPLNLAPQGGGLQDLPAYLQEYRATSGGSQSAPAGSQ